MREEAGMPIKSLEDLKRLKEEALRKRAIRHPAARARITVAMGTCGLTVGARDTMKAILETIKQNQIRDVLVLQTGCIGLCEYEPLVEVHLGEDKVTYGKVTPDRARAIVTVHVMGGHPIKEWMITP